MRRQVSIRSTVTGLMALAILVTAQSFTLAQKREKLEPEVVYERTVLGTVWITAKTSHGSGWILDKEKGYIVTNYHCVDSTEQPLVYFPRFEDGRLVTDQETYEKYTKPTKAIIVDSDVEKDLAILKVDRIPSRCRELPVAKRSASPGQRVHAIGGQPRGSQGMFVYANGNVRQVSNGRTALGGKARILATTIAINPGNSGGPVVNDYGEVVGVAEGEVFNARDVTWAVDVEDLNRYVKLVNGLYPTKTADDNYQALLRHYTAKHFNNAIEYANRAIRMNPKHTNAYNFRAWCYHSKRDYKTALRDFSTCLEIDPGHDESYRGRGGCKWYQGDHRGAIADYTKALKLNPGNKWAHLDRARAYRDMGKIDDAIKEYANAVKNNPTSYLPYNERGGLYLRKKQLGYAQKDFEQVIKLNPRYWGGYNDLGICFLRDKRYDLAKRYFSLARDANPRHYQPHYNLATVMYHTKQYDLAIEYATMSIDYRPKYSEAFALRALIHANRKDYRSAHKDINQAIGLNGTVASYYYDRHLYLKQLGYNSDAEKDLAMARKLQDSRHTVAKPSSSSGISERSFAGTWRYNGTYEGIKYDCAIQFVNNTFAYYFTYTDSRGVPRRFEDKGNFTVNRGDVNLNGTKFKFQFKDNYLWLTFPQVNIKFPMKRSKN